MATDLIARGLATRAGSGGSGSAGPTINVSAHYLPEHGLNLRMAYQAAINAAALLNGRVLNDYGAVTQQIWEKTFDTPNVFDVASINRNRTLTIPACSSIEIDFAGANIVLKGPTGGNRFADGGQTVPGLIAAGFGFATWNGKWVAGFLIVLGVIRHLKILNVDVEGGFTGDTVNQDNVILFDKGFLCQDLGDNALGAGVGMGRIIMDNVVLHGFAGEIMYDNSARHHISRDCHFYNSGHSCWNPSGIGKLDAYNLQAGIARQPAEVLCGLGHTYYGGRFYKGGGAGCTFIGGPDPGFSGLFYNSPHRLTTAPPPYVFFHGTRFEDFPTSFVHLGSYMRGSIYTTDASVFLAAGFASAEELKDIDLDVYSTCDRASAFNAVALYGPATDDGSQPKNIRLRIHGTRTELAKDNSRNQAGLQTGGLLNSDCRMQLDGMFSTAFNTATPAGGTLPYVNADAATELGLNYFYFGANQVYLPSRRDVILTPTGAGTFDFTMDTSRAFSDQQLFTFRHDGSGSTDRIVSFAKNGAGLRLAADRTLRRAGEYLRLRYSIFGATWVEDAYMGQGV